MDAGENKEIVKVKRKDVEFLQIYFVKTKWTFR
jgi:hypothetical protein